MTAFLQVPHLCTTYWTSTGTVIKTRKGMPTSFRTTPVQKGEIHVKKQGWGDGHSLGRQKSSLLVNYHWFPTVHTCSHGLISIRCISMSLLWVKLHFALIWIWIYRSVNSFKRPMGTFASVVDKYNHTMGGVDLGDQLILQFEPQFKSLKCGENCFFTVLSRQVVLFFWQMSW